MVLSDYDTMDDIYEEIRLAACGRQACSVIVLVAAEVDAMASARLLTKLFRSDNIAYKIRPVSNFSHIEEIVPEVTATDIKTVVMINCGAIYNVSNVFGLERGGDIRCFIIDNHRPVHLTNIHSNYNVVVLNDGSIVDDIPSDGSDLCADESQATSSESEDDEGLDDDAISQGELSENDSVSERSDEKEILANTSGDFEFEREEGDVEGEGAKLQALDQDVTRNGNNFTGAINFEYGGGNDALLSGAEDENEDEYNIKIVGRKRKALIEKYDPKQARKRKIRAYYGNGNSYSIPTSVMLITLVKKLNRVCTSDILWQAILGATDHFQKAHISESLYDAICAEIKKQLPECIGQGTYSVGILEGGGDDESEQVVVGSKVTIPASETGHIYWTEEYRFFMHRHWSLYDAMYHSNYVASKLEVWKTQGTAKLKEMLARMGIPLQQSRQSFSYMTPTLRTHFRRQIFESEIAHDYGLESPGMLYQSFYRYNSFKNPVAAADVVNAVNSLLEMDGDESHDMDSSPLSGTDVGINNKEKVGDSNVDAFRDDRTAESSDYISPKWLRCFNEAYDCMSMRQPSEKYLKKGISLAISLQKAIVGQASTMLERPDAITRLKCFRYAFISRSAGGSNGNSFESSGRDGTTESIFGRSNVLMRLANFLMDVQRSNGAWAGRKSKPLILAAEKGKTFLVVGVVPVTTEELKEGIPPTKFRHYFKMAAIQTKARYRSDGFDTAVIEISRSHINDFIEDLMFMMT